VRPDPVRPRRCDGTAAGGDGTAAGGDVSGADARGLVLTVNGDDRTVPEGATVADLVADLGLEPRGIAVAIEGEVVTRRTWAGRPLVAGERVEVLTIAQGG